MGERESEAEGKGEREREKVSKREGCRESEIFLCLY